jgi:DOPA 4,5-dioxygenase
MENIRRPVNTHHRYHAHVYFDQETLDFATSLCEEAGKQFNIGVGRIHQRLVGPHTRWSCQLSFGEKDFDQVIPWLDDHRKGLSILVHAMSGDNLKDHTSYAYWLGKKVDLDLSLFGA